MPDQISEQVYVTKYVFENNKTNKLKHKPQILLYIEEQGEADAYDIVDFLYCTIYLASKLLRELWENEFLQRRRKKIRGRGRPGFIYELTKKGGLVCHLLHKKGY